MILLMESQQFFTPDALASFTTSVAIVVVIGNTLRVLVKRDWRLIPFIVALAVAYLGAAIAGVNKWWGWILPIANGCLLYWSAFGAEIALVELKTGAPTGGPRPHGKQRVAWLSHWGAPFS